LDPEATGVLIAGVGKGTKHLQSFLECTKTYETVVLFGAATDTYDAVGKIVNKAPYGHVTRDEVEKVLGAFRGSIMQKPPIYSALRVQGKRLYDYARSGLALPSEIQPRPVEVVNLEIVEWMEGGTHKYQWPQQDADDEEKRVVNEVLHLPQGEKVTPGIVEGTKRKLETDDQAYEDEDTESRPPKRAKAEGCCEMTTNTTVLGQENEEPQSGTSQTQISPGPSSPQLEKNGNPQETPPAVKLRMTVTSGFYVRSLCHDLGRAMDTFAIMSSLVRTRQGDFEIGRNVLEYTDLEGGEEVWGPKVKGYLEKWTETREPQDRSPRR
jgi:tRNA pseudouridine55 synthase